MGFADIWGLVKQTASEWMEDNVSRLAAALAYYTIFAIAPLLVIAIFVAGLIWSADAAQKQVYVQLKGFMGDSTATAVQGMVKSASETGGGVWATIIGIALLIYGSTNVFASLQDSLNTIWEVKVDPTSGWGAMVRARLFSFGMVLGIGFLLLVSLVVSTVLSAMVNFVGGEGAFWGIVNFVIFIPIATALFAMIFKYLPDVDIAWGDVWIGAGVTAVLFAAGKFLIGLYLGQSSVTSVYGGAGSLVVLLIWVYYSSLILFFGAEFTQVYARRYGRSIRPDDYAVPVTADERAHQGMASADEVKSAAEQKKRPRGVMGESPTLPGVAEPVYAVARRAYVRRPGLAGGGTGFVNVAVGAVAGMALAWAGMWMKRKSRGEDRQVAMVNRRIEDVQGRLRAIDRTMGELAARQPGVMDWWTATKQALGSGRLRPDRRSAIRRTVERWMHGGS